MMRLCEIFIPLLPFFFNVSDILMINFLPPHKRDNYLGIAFLRRENTLTSSFSQQRKINITEFREKGQILPDS